MPRRLLRLLALCVLLVSAAPAGALDRDRSVAQLQHTAWTARDGAPSQISALAQTRDGYLWIGSARGLYRFDGVSFDLLKSQAGQALPSFNIYALQATHDGGLWIAFRPSGLGYFAHGHLQVFRGRQIPPSIVFNLAEDGAHRIWAGTFDGLSLRQGAQWIDIGPERGIPRSRVWTMLATGDGALWVANKAGVYRLPPRSQRFVRVTDTVGTVDTMAEAGDGSVWIADEGSPHMQRCTPDGGTCRSIVDTAVDGSKVNDLLFDRDGSLWITLSFGGVRRIRDPAQLVNGAAVAVDRYTKGDGLTSDALGQLLEDREGNVWVSTMRGLDRFRHNQLVPVPLPADQQNFTLMAAPDGSVWVGGSSFQGIDRIDDRVAAGLAPAGIIPGSPGFLGSVYTGDLSRSGTVWWGGKDGVWRQRDGRFVHYPGPGPEWAWEVMASGGDGQVWVGYGDTGVWRIEDDGRWERPGMPAGMLARAPSASFTTASGVRWFGYTGNRAAALVNGRFHAYTASDGLDVGRIRVIRGGGRPMWLGGETGLSMFIDGRFHTVAMTGVPPQGTVCGIVPAASGDLWLSELHGVVRIDAAEVRALVADPGHVARATLFDYLDGLPGATQMNWCSSAAIQARDGRLWFATDSGLAWLDPQRLRYNGLAPPVYIRDVVADGSIHHPVDGLSLPPGTANLRVDFTAPSLTMPERVAFRYRLDGLDDGWQEAGTRREASYTHLGPGSYVFHVVASNNDGVWNMQGARLAFRIQPRFYQTGWFFLLCLMAGMGLVLLLLWLRTQQIRSLLRAQMEARHGERERIARELHDTLLQGVQGLILRVHAATRTLGADHPARRSMDRALDQAEEILVEGRDRLGELRAGAPKHFDLASALARLADEQLPGIEFGMVVEGLVRPLAPEAGEEIYQVGREAILNAVHHASPGSLHCHLSYRMNEFEMCIRDDGRGIDPDILEQGGRPGHWGLAGMRERAAALRGRISIVPDDAGGTRVTLTVPGGIAYARSDSGQH